MLTQKDLYDYIAKNGADAYDKMATELADNINKAKAAYEADQEKKAKKAALVQKRNDAFADLFHEFWAPEDIAPLGYDTLAKTICEAVDNFGKQKDYIMKHAKDVKTETTKIPGGTKTVVTGTLNGDDLDKILEEFLNGFVDGFTGSFK